MFGLRDPSGIASNMILLSPDVFYLLQFFDGKHSRPELCRKYRQAFGSSLEERQLTTIVSDLDAHLFLDSRNFVRRLEEMEREFIAAPVRPAVHAGHSYEADPERLRGQLDGFFASELGPGFPNGRVPRIVKGLVAPHIDIRAGGATYAHAYKALAEAEPADCYVILGTGHSGLRNLYSVLDKDFETPYGRARCDHAFVQQLRANHQGFECDEILPHKTEHTIEFQVVFLQHLFQGRRDFTFVPILCSFSYHMLDAAHFQRERAVVDSFCRALKKTVAESGKRVCLIASVDFSHVGPRYGDEESPSPDFLARVREADLALVRHAEMVNSDGFYRSVLKKRDRFRVCGFSPIYTLLRSIEAERGELLHYAHTAVDNQNSTVTFSSIAFY